MQEWKSENPKNALRQKQDYLFFIVAWMIMGRGEMDGGVWQLRRREASETMAWEDEEDNEAKDGEAASFVPRMKT